MLHSPAVGSVATVWHGVVNPPRTNSIREWRYDDVIELKKGAEMGRFLLGSTIVMPHDAPEAKVRATRGYGADIVRYDRFTEDREAISRRIAGEHGAMILPP